MCHRDVMSQSMYRYLAFHSRGGNHCHLNFIGVPSMAAAGARDTIEQAAAKHQFSLQHIDAAQSQDMREAVQKVVQKQQYFQVYLPDGSRLVHPISRCDTSERHNVHCLSATSFCIQLPCGV